MIIAVIILSILLFNAYFHFVLMEKVVFKRYSYQMLTTLFFAILGPIVGNIIILPIYIIFQAYIRHKKTKIKREYEKEKEK
jgi:ABC-type phosphate/phosphonate transport system permease subunit